MKNLSRLAAPALFSLLMATPAMADEDRWYLAGDVGFGNLASTSLTYIDPNSSASASTSFDVSFAGGGTFGYRISDRFSIEGEIKYRRNEFGSVDLGDLGSFSGGDFASLGFGLNLLYRFPISDDGKLSGYIGPGYLYLQEIDIDFDDEGRSKVMDYVIGKYGANQVAQIITYGTMAAKSSIRDTARVLDLPLGDADRIAKLIPNMAKFGKIFGKPEAELKQKFRADDYEKINQLLGISEGDDLEALLPENDIG